MSEEFAEPAFRLNWRVILPSAVALTLFVVLAGLIAAVVVGITADPPEEPEIAAAQPPAATTPEAAPDELAGQAEPAPADQAAAPAETAPAVASPDMSAGTADAQSTEPTPDVTAGDVAVQSEAPAPEPAAEPAAAPTVGKPPEEPTETAAATPPAVPKPPNVLPRAQTGGGLRPAPDPALIEQSSFGPLPRIGANGREPWQAYARPVPGGDDRPRVAVILSGLGLSSAATEAAIQGLPGEVTLAFQPFADNIQQWIRLARAAGHEVLLNLPMEPVDFPANDPGPRALFVTLSPDENEERLRWALSRVTGYVGVVNHMGSRFTTSREAMQPILAEIKARGLLYVDARSSARSIATVMATQMQVPRAINDRFLDSREVSRVTIDARLIELERIAKDAGVSIAIGQAFPVTIERVREWAQTLEGKGLALVPVSAVVNTQADR
ncbi:MAG: divergent polysaccharide deacetylase family protein [Alphaproteobacteria bacterium]